MHVGNDLFLVLNVSDDGLHANAEENNAARVRRDLDGK